MPHTHDLLATLVARIRCKPGWSFCLETAVGDVYPKLVIRVPGYDSAGASSTIDRVIRASERLELALQRQRTMIVDPEALAAVTELHEAWGQHRRLSVSHFHPVPEATYNEASWTRWVFERCRGIENHELGEWFRVGVARPFAPLHGPGEDPYTVHEFRPARDALTTQDGNIREPYQMMSKILAFALVVAVLAACTAQQVQTTCDEARAALVAAQPFLALAPPEVQLAVTLIGAGTVACDSPQFLQAVATIESFLASKGVSRATYYRG